MLIKEILIKNYRGVKKEEKIPLSNLSCIVGRNDSGKSIVLNAVASFLDTKKYEIVNSDFNDPGNQIELTCSFSDEKMIEKVKERITIKKDDGLDEFVRDIVEDNILTIKKIFSRAGKAVEKDLILMRDYQDPAFAGLYAKTDEELNVIIESSGITIPVSGSGRNSKLEKIKSIKDFCENAGFTKEPRYIEDAYKIVSLLPGVELFYSDYGLEADTSFKTGSVSEVKHIFESEQKNEKGALKIAEEKIESEMQKEAQSIKIFMKEYTAELEDVQIVPAFDWPKAIPSVDVKFKFNGDSYLIPMSHKGTGYRRLFMVARFRYLAEKNKGKDIVYLIEEPETFLHPSAQEDLLNALRELSSDNQIIISTHSPVFTGAVDYHSVVLCEKTDQSHYEFADETKKEVFMQKIIKELGIRPYYNLQDKHTKILFVEGSNDVEFYNLVAQKILGNNLKSDDVLCLPIGGKECLEYFVNIDYFNNSGKKIFLILDKDSHLAQVDQDKQVERRDEFIKKKNSSAYILERACIENYYHPRAFERFYSLSQDSLSDFPANANIRELVKKIREENPNAHISGKNDFGVWREMTTEEWNQLIEDDLKDFINNIIEG